MHANESKAIESEPPRTTKEFVLWLWRRIWQKKKLWLLPVWALLAAVAILLVLSGNGALLPAIYVAF